MPVSRAPMPSVAAPGRSRPMTRSQAATGCRRMEVSPLISGSCWSGNHRSGGSGFSVSPKNPGGITPATVNAWPSMTTVDPTIVASPP
jgi:hypothetical protein